MKYISTFTGVGGFDLGLDRSGFECIGQVEIDSHCRNVLRYHYPNVKRKSDVRQIRKTTFPVPDLICGGFPCQDLSVAGKRKGLAGSRSGLFFEFARIVSVFKPKWFVLENVPGLLSSKEGRDFAVILREMDELGYLQAWRVFDSQYFGVAQRRRRVFIVGSLGNGSCAEILFESESLCRNPSEGRKEGQGVAANIAPSLNASGRGVSRAGESRGQDPVVAVPDIAWALQERDCKGADSDTKEGHLIVSATETGRGFYSEGKPRLRCSSAPSQPQTIMAFHTRQDPCNSDKAYALENSTPQANAVCFQQNTRDEVREIRNKVAGSLSAEPEMKQQNYIAQQVQWASGGGKVLNDTAQSLRSEAEHNYQFIKQNMAVRRLTPRECERLQGFPDSWTKYGIDENGKKIEISDTQRYKMLGNAISVPVAHWIGKRIIKHK